MVPDKSHRRVFRSAGKLFAPGILTDAHGLVNGLRQCLKDVNFAQWTRSISLAEPWMCITEMKDMSPCELTNTVPIEKLIDT
jgi:hypothetical protein